MTQQISPRVVVGVDGSAPSVRALRWAAHEAALHNADLAAVIVDNAVAPAPYAPVRAEPAEAHRAHLSRILAAAITEAVGARPEVPVRGYVEEGRVADVLARYSADAEMLVLGNRGADDDAAWVAPTIRSCLRRAACHVVVVNENDEVRREHVAAS